MDAVFWCYIMGDRDLQMKIGNDRLRNAIGFHTNSLEILRSLTVHFKAAKLAVRKCNRKLRYARKLVSDAEEDQELARVSKELAVSQLENMELDVGVECRSLGMRGVCRQLVILRSYMSTVDSDDSDGDGVEEGPGEAVMEQQVGLLRALVDGFKVSEMEIRKSILVCAEGLTSSRRARVECLGSCLVSLEEVVTTVRVKMVEATEALGRRAERVRAARAELALL